MAANDNQQEAAETGSLQPADIGSHDWDTDEQCLDAMYRMGLHGPAADGMEAAD